MIFVRVNLKVERIFEWLLNNKKVDSKIEVESYKLFDYNRNYV